MFGYSLHQCFLEPAGLVSSSEFVLVTINGCVWRSVNLVLSPTVLVCECCLRSGSVLGDGYSHCLGSLFMLSPL